MGNPQIHTGTNKQHLCSHTLIIMRPVNSLLVGTHQPIRPTGFGRAPGRLDEIRVIFFHKTLPHSHIPHITALYIRQLVDDSRAPSLVSQSGPPLQQVSSLLANSNSNCCEWYCTFCWTVQMHHDAVGQTICQPEHSSETADTCNVQSHTLHLLTGRLCILSTVPVQLKTHL